MTAFGAHCVVFPYAGRLSGGAYHSTGDWYCDAITSRVVVMFTRVFA